MTRNKQIKIQDLQLFSLEEADIKGNIPEPKNDYIEFKKEDIDQSIVSRFEEQVKKFPHKIAVKSSANSLTYHFLNQFSNRLSHMISRESGQSSTVVALLFGHDVEMLVGIIGTLKSGNIYVPLVPNYPVERLKYILEDSGAAVIVTDNDCFSLARELSTNANQLMIINLEDLPVGLPLENPALPIISDNPAYILYTSGSTGRPKGVLQNHKNVLHFARLYTNGLHINSNDRLTLLSSYNFDAAKMDIFGALLNGASLYPYNISLQGGFLSITRWLLEEKITIYHSIPTLYRYFIDMLTGNEYFNDLRFIVLGGEAVYREDVEKYKKYFPNDCLFINGLGPTESTVTLQYFIDKKTEIAKEAVPVGYAVDETKVFLVDDNNAEAQVYGVGEILYSSDYLALGYLNDPQKTNTVFSTHPFKNNGRVFRSGDLGKLLPDGSIEFVGRKDFQVKIRGYRVELGEIEGRLDRIHGIQKSVVICEKNNTGENFLVAYYVKDKQEMDEENLMRTLRDLLPDYMLPNYFVQLDSFPLTQSGKIDRKMLPKHEHIKTREEYEAPRNEVEKKLAQIWAEVLRIEKDKISINHDFFELGGHSLRAVAMSMKIHRELDVKILITEIFRNPGFKDLSSFINRKQKDKLVSIPLAEKKEYYPLSPGQKRLYIIQHLEPAGTAYNMPMVFMLEGKLYRQQLEDSITKLIHRHEMLRTSFQLINGLPFQRLHKNVESIMEYNVLDAESAAPIIRSFIRPFDLSCPPLFRVGVIKIREDEHILMADMHHITTDAISNQIMIHDLVNLYLGVRVEKLVFQYKDFSQWQNKQIVSGEMKKQETFWLKKLERMSQGTIIKTDYPRPPTRTNKGDIISFHITPEETKQLRKLAKEENTTQFMVSLALFNILLHKISTLEDILVGTVASGRSGHSDLQNIIGFFSNTLVLRNYPRKNKTFIQLLREVKKTTLEAFDNQDYQFYDLIEKLKLEREPGRNPLFDILFSFTPRNIPHSASSSTNHQETEPYRFTLKPYSSEKGITSKFDVHFRGTETEDRISFAIIYCTDIFKKVTIENWSQYFKLIVSAVSKNQSVQLKNITISHDLRMANSNIYDDKKEVEFDF